MLPNGNMGSWCFPRSSPTSLASEASLSRYSATTLLPVLEGHDASPPSSDESGVCGEDAAAPNKERKPAEEGDGEMSEPSKGDASRESGETDAIPVGGLCAGIGAVVSDVFVLSRLLCVAVVMMPVACAVVDGGS